MNPRFSIGEKVVLTSDEFSKYNGEYLVSEIVQPKEDFTDRLTFRTRENRTSNIVGYLLSECHLSDDGENEILWAESALRKKHQPTSLSFNQLMNVLNNPIASPNGVGVK